MRSWPHGAGRPCSVTSLEQWLTRGLIAASAILLCFGCGDERSDSERIAAACKDACGSVAPGCGLETPMESCRAACELGGSLSSGCAREYEGYLSCAADQTPLVSCDGDSVTISASVSVCVSPLTSYLGCAATAASPACLDAPEQNADCEAEGLGTRATVCAGEPAGCNLLEGSLRAEGAGLFCCP